MNRCLGRAALLPMWAVLTFFLAGCGAETTDPPPDPQASISVLGRMYGEFAGTHGRGPKDEAEFKQFLNNLDPKRREVLGLTDVNAAFTSPLDQQPYIVKYGLQGSSGDEKHPEWQAVVSEKTGASGERLQASETGTVTKAAAAGS